MMVNIGSALISMEQRVIHFSLLAQTYSVRLTGIPTGDIGYFTSNIFGKKWFLTKLVNCISYIAPNGQIVGNDAVISGRGPLKGTIP
jgi:hypothetical protein